MKFIKSKLLQKAKGRKRGKYLITLEVSDYDLDMIEDFATTYAPLEKDETPEKYGLDAKFTGDYKDKYKKWLLQTWKQFWKLWNKYDD